MITINNDSLSINPANKIERILNTSRDFLRTVSAATKVIGFIGLALITGNIQEERELESHHEVNLVHPLPVAPPQQPQTLPTPTALPTISATPTEMPTATPHHHHHMSLLPPGFGIPLAQQAAWDDQIVVPISQKEIITTG